MQDSSNILDATVGAVGRGYQVIPITFKAKNPRLNGWPHWKWPEGQNRESIRQQLENWTKTTNGETNIGVILGDSSGRLVDVDLDHYRTARLKEYFLPPTPAKSGRPGKPNSHYWYICEEGTLPGTRQHLMPRMEQPDGTWKKGPVIVELRANGAQTLIPPSVHPSGENYAWSGEPWGGALGPTVVNGRRLAMQVALLALASVLLEHWPTEGSRHEAYLALAGGLLRDGDVGVHPYWEQNASVLIRALAEATLDDDGPDARESESIKSTIDGLQNGRAVTGFGKLAEIIGDEAVKQVRILIGEVESAAGVQSRQAPAVTVSVEQEVEARNEQIGALTPEERDPLDERVGTWEPVDLEPYLSGQIVPVEPTIMRRDDGQALFYPGRVNMLYGSSESAKSWIALYTCIQEMTEGQRVMYLDFEDEPVNTLDRMKRMGAGADDLRFLFTYIRPEDALAPMQRDRWGTSHISPVGLKNQELFEAAVETIDPVLVVADGMTVLYGLHGLDANDSVSTDIITGWLKKLTRNGRTTVIIIDHTTKGAERGSTPIGSGHKQAMVQGSMIQVWPVKQPMPDAVGEVELIVLKDRPGQVRKHSVKSGMKAQLAAQVTLDSTVPGVTTVQIKPPLDPNNPQTQAQKAADAAKYRTYQEEEDKLLALYGDVVGSSKPLSEIFLSLGIVRNKDGEWPADDSRKWSEALKRLIDKGWIYTEGKTRGRRYTLAMAVNDPSGVDLDLTGAGTD